MLYQRLGKYAEAEVLFIKVLDVRRRRLRPDHADTLRAMTSLGLVRLQQGKYADAESLLRDGVSGYRKPKRMAGDATTARACWEGVSPLRTSMLRLNRSCYRGIRDCTSAKPSYLMRTGRL